MAAEPLTLPEAVRFLEQLHACAVNAGKAGSIARWISVFGADDRQRAVRRGLSLKAIRAVNDVPGRDIFARYPGATEDTYYQAALDAFIPRVRRQARVDALVTLAAQVVTIGQLARDVRDDKIAARLHTAAIPVWNVVRVLDMPVRKKGEVSALTPEEYAELFKKSAKADVVTRLRRVICMREVRKSGDQLLLRLMAPQTGTQIVAAFANGVPAGRLAAARTLGACNSAVLETHADLLKDTDRIWKLRPPLGSGSAKIAAEAGRTHAAAALTAFALAYAQYETGKVESALDVANNAVMALSFMGPAGALAGDILGVVLASIGAALSLLDEMWQDQAALATTFADDADKLSQGGKANAAALKGAASILAAVVPFGLSRLVGRTAKAGAAIAGEIEGAAARDARAAARPRSGTHGISGERQAAADVTTPVSPSKGEIQAARQTGADEVLAAARKPKPLKQPKYADVALPENQKATVERLAGRMFTDESQLAVPAALSPERAKVLGAAEANAADLRRRLAAHWAGALPRRGNQSAQQAAKEILDSVVKEGLTGSAANKEVRRRLFSRWRQRFLDAVGNDATLVTDLRDRAGVIFNRHAGEGGNAFGVPFRDAEGKVHMVGLDVDHATIGHAQAVEDALRTGDPEKLVSTVDAENLQLLTQRENRNFIEPIRKQDRVKWTPQPGREIDQWGRPDARGLPEIAPPSPVVETETDWLDWLSPARAPKRERVK
jgi:hypothetical protein